jgi:hypothetical protein
MNLKQKLDAEEWKILDKLREKEFASKAIEAKRERLHKVNLFHYEYLKYSPSYTRVFKDKTHKSLVLKKPEDRNDEEKIIWMVRTYGDVWRRSYRDWHSSTFIPSQVFKSPIAYENINWLWIHKVTDKDLNEQEVLNYVVDGFKAELKFAKNHDHVYLRIPLQGVKKDVVREVSDVLDVLGFDNKKPIKTNRLIPASKRINFKALEAGLELLTYKAFNPTLELWRLGLLSNVSPVYSKLLNPNSSRKVSSSDEEIYRDNLAKLTHRALKKYESIAENAAYGNFPVSTPQSKIKFDYDQIAKRLMRQRA